MFAYDHKSTSIPRPLPWEKRRNVESLINETLGDLGALRGRGCERCARVALAINAVDRVMLQIHAAPRTVERACRPY